MADDLPAAFRAAITSQQLFSKASRILVGVSGGMDSIALLHLLRALPSSWKPTLMIAHLDHGLRPESAADAAFVRELAARGKLRACIEREDVQARCRQEGWSLEDGARRIRYEFFRRAASAHSAAYVALAHTADDQAETVLMRLLRGAGLMGLGAIPAKRLFRGLSIVRPLLGIWRRQIAGYVAHHRLAYREDATNADERFVRNRIRHRLLPLLEREYNPNIKGALARLAEQSRSDYAYLEDAAGRQWKRTAKEAGKETPRVAISVARFLRQPKALQRQLVRQAIQRLRGELTAVEFRHWEEAERLFQQRPVGTLLDLPGGVQFRREKDHVVCQLSLSASGLRPSAD